jgi:hypothetical protein
VFISTLIVIYTVFISVHGALLAQVTDAKRKREPWEGGVSGAV